MTHAGDKARERLEMELAALVERAAASRGVRHVILGVESGDRSFRWVKASGVARPDGAPMKEDTPFFIASVTKLFIAAATLKLCERGAFELDRPVAACLPPRLINGLHRLKGIDRTGEITIRHLLSHTSGLPDWLMDRPRGGVSLADRVEKEPDRLIGIEEAIALARDELTPHFPPQPLGKRRPKTRYSDTNFQVLMAVIEAKTGKPVHEVFDELLLRPLGLRRTWHPGHRQVEAEDRPASFWLGDEPFEKPGLIESFRDLMSTADDLLAFMRALVEGTVFDRRETVLLMRERWNRFGLPTDMAALMQPNWPIEYGLGMMRFKMPRIFTPFSPIPAVIGHTGSTGSWLFYCPDYDLYFCGTVDQLTAAPLPYRTIVPGILRAYGRFIG